ncbi:choice-of-anchor J domain-containing protein [uncultured Draconibacterium sp.]|uniref:choice-of-anchor J domain-containing protein n=1 Tax=uncultured Draconibacterium sp. TaxID=1573823 RepID=UPI0025E8F3F1|nr:choice-of-anchor J domain-containing protein [uncultured Draconibacterium sp.]
MKKITYLFAILALIFATACNSLDDIHEEIDAMDNPIVGDVEYTLTDEDYDDLDLGYGSFNSVDDAKEMLPAFLTEKYPVWGNGSSVLVGYKLYVGSAPGVGDYTYADEVEMEDADYPQSEIGAVGFLPSEDALALIPDYLDGAVADPAEGDIVLVRYEEHVSNTVAQSITLLEEGFNGTLGDFTPEYVAGPTEWENRDYSGVEYAYMSAYGDGVVENYLVSPAVDLSDYSNVVVRINQAINYASGNLDLASVLVSTDYDGDVTTATWDVLTLEEMPSGGDWTFVLSEPVDLSAYEGETINIAFKYQSTEDVAPAWEIDNIVVSSGIKDETISKAAYFTYNEDGEWEASEGVYFLSSADLDAMGEDYGRPGYYNNFSSSISPLDYLPAFMVNTYPYGQEEDAMTIVYDYYSSSTGAQLRGTLFTFTAGEWAAYESTQDVTLQFAHDGTTWVPDNTIKYTFTSGDYALVVDQLGSTYPSETGNLASYGNFNLFSWTDEMLLEAVTLVIENNYPSAEEGQKFAVTYTVYDGSTHDDVMNIILEGGVYVMQ